MYDDRRRNVARLAEELAKNTGWTANVTYSQCMDAIRYYALVNKDRPKALWFSSVARAIQIREKS